MSILDRYYQLVHAGVERGDALIRARAEAKGTAPVLLSAGYQCQECGRRFRSASAALRATDRGCPGCGGSDIDLAT